MESVQLIPVLDSIKEFRSCFRNLLELDREVFCLVSGFHTGILILLVPELKVGT